MQKNTIYKNESTEPPETGLELTWILELAQSIKTYILCVQNFEWKRT
jgi:hypothetical protein